MNKSPLNDRNLALETIVTFRNSITLSRAPEIRRQIGKLKQIHDISEPEIESRLNNTFFYRKNK